MGISELTNLIQNNSDKITSMAGYKAILNRGNNLIRFDVLNRILIYLQLENAFDLKTVDEWAIVGRRIRNNQNPVFIILPKYKTTYIETDTGRSINESDLTPDELLKALEYNIVRREDNIETVYKIALYDIRQTIKTNDTEYNINKPVLNSSSVLQLLSDVTGATIEVCDEDYYSVSSNAIFICKKQYKELASTVSKFLVKYIMSYKLEDILINTLGIQSNDLSKYEMTLLENSLDYTLCTLLATESSVDLSYLQHVTYDNIINILNVVDSAISEIIKYIKFTDNDNSLDAITTITKLHKAEVILDVMEANSINKIMKGNWVCKKQ